MSSRFHELAPRDGLLVRAAVLPGPSAWSAWQEWYSGVVLDELPFDEARLLPRVFANLAAQGATRCLPPRLRGKYRWVWTSNQLRTHAVAPAIRSLLDAGMPTLLLKGAALLASRRCAWGAREMGDVDILVPAERLGEAATLVGDAGWCGQSGVTPDFLVRRLGMRRHSWNYASETPSGNLDLHWCVFEGLRSPEVAGGLFARSRSVRFGSVELRALDDIDQVLHLIEHAAHGESAHRLVWIADTASVLDHINGDDLARRARDLDLHDVVAEGLDTVAKTLGTPQSRSIADTLTRYGTRRREQALAFTETGTLRGRTYPRVSELVRAAIVHGAEPRHPFRGIRTLLQRRLEPDVCSHPLVSAGLAWLGRPRRVEVALLRYVGPLARPPTPRQLQPGEWADLTTADGIDRVAGPGWAWPMPEGVWTDGGDARLALDVAVAAGRPLTLEFRFGDEARHSPNARAMVLVNGRALVTWTFGGEPEHTSQRLAIPAWLADWCRPMDVAIRPLRPFVPRHRVGAPGDIQRAVQLRAVRVVEA